MKTKIIATVLGVMAMASLTYYPNTMAYAEEVTGKTPITWTDYKAVSVTENIRETTIKKLAMAVSVRRGMVKSIQFVRR